MSGMDALARIGHITADAAADREAMANVEHLIAADLAALYDGHPMVEVPIPEQLPLIDRRSVVTGLR